MWDLFWEGASLIDSSPALIYYACLKILQYPTTYGRGTSSLKCHIITRQYKQAGKCDSTGQLKLDHLL
jgi:hypothetical protein